MKTKGTSAALVRRFSLIEWTYWSINGSFRSYGAAFALSRGYSQAWISDMMAFAALAALLGLVLWSALSDRFRTNKKTFLLCLALILPANLGIFFSPNQTLFFWTYMLLGFVDGAAAVILDTWILRSLNSDMAVFSKLRSYGSIGYALTMLTMGPMIEFTGFAVMPAVSALMVVLTFTGAVGLEDVHVEVRRTGTTSGLRERFGLLMIPQYVLLLSIVLLLGFAVCPVSSLKIALLQNVGGNVAWQGIDSFVACTLQFFAFRFVPKLSRKMPTQYQLLLCGLFMLTSMVLNYTAHAPLGVVLGSCGIMLTYALLIPASRQVVMACVPIQQQTVANSLSDACYNSVSCLISMLYAGRIAENYGIRMMIFVSGLFAAGAVLISLLSLVKKNSDKPGNGL